MFDGLIAAQFNGDLGLGAEGPNLAFRRLARRRALLSRHQSMFDHLVDGQAVEAGNRVIGRCDQNDLILLEVHHLQLVGVFLHMVADHTQVHLPVKYPLHDRPGVADHQLNVDSRIDLPETGHDDGKNELAGRAAGA